VNAKFYYSPKTPVKLSTNPTFYRFIIHVPDNAAFATLSIAYSLPKPESRVFMDGLFLASGEHSNMLPNFADPKGTVGTWDGRTYAIQLIGHGKPRLIPETPDGTYKV
jgi:hypothetical protein